MSVYIVDANFFIQAHRDRFPMDVAPSFWKKLKQLADEGKIISIEKVKHEIYHNNDSLTQWCTDNLPSDFFKDSSQTINHQYIQVTQWVMTRNTHYKQNAINEFLDADEADAWLVAFALEDSNRVLVTYEISEPNTRSKVKIPEACNAVGVSFITPIEMFRALGESF